MPLKSKAQMRYLFSQHPEIAKRFAAETPDISKLPEKASAGAGQAAVKKVLHERRNKFPSQYGQ